MQYGIPESRHLDGGSRGAGQGTYNYVVLRARKTRSRSSNATATRYRGWRDENPQLIGPSAFLTDFKVGRSTLGQPVPDDRRVAGRGRAGRARIGAGSVHRADVRRHHPRHARRR